MATKKKMLQAAAGNATGGAGLNVEDVFSTYLYEGNGSTQTITNGIDLDGEGGLVWTKVRDQTGDHALMNSESSWLTELASNKTDAEGTTSYVNFVDNSNGYSMNTAASRWNESARDYVSWTFRKAPKFFDVVTWTGDGADARQISHSLGATVGSIFVKNTNSGNTEWMVYHRSLSNDLPNHSLGLVLNQTYGQLSWKAFGEHATQTSSVFTLGTNSPNEFFVNASGETYVAYLFAHNDGDGEFGPDGDADIIKCGSFTSTSSTQEIDLGFEPQWVLFKNSTDTQYGEWRIFDTMRGMSETESKYLAANSSDSEATNNPLVTAYSQGFKTDVSAGGSGKTYIYMAIRRGTKVPESATEVFAIDTADNTVNPLFTSGISIDMALSKVVTSASTNYISSRLAQGEYLKTDGNDPATVNVNLANFAFQNGYYSGGATNTNNYSWMWKRAPGFFDVVAYTGNSTAGRTVSHNLGVAPEMIWVKNRDTTNDWNVWHSALTATQSLRLNLTNDVENNSWFTASPTDQAFFTNSYQGINASGNDYIAYLFASLDGISKVGSFSHTNGSATNVDCGFSSGARFIIIKQSNAASDWRVYDTVRGIVSGNDAYLNLNETTQENSGDFVDPLSSGFTVTDNYDTGTYIFYAIA